MPADVLAQLGRFDAAAIADALSALRLVVPFHALEAWAARESLTLAERISPGSSHEPLLPALGSAELCRRVLGEVPELLGNALELLAHLDPVAAEPLALAAFDVDPEDHPTCTALASCGTEAAVERLVTAVQGAESCFDAAANAVARTLHHPELGPRLLAAIEASRLFDRPPVEHPTLAKWLRLKVAERSAFQVPNALHFHPARAFIEALGRVGHEPAIELLDRIVATHPADGLRGVAAEALAAMGHPRATELIAARLSDHSDGVIRAAARSLFLADPEAAFDRLAPYFEPKALRSRARRRVAQMVLYDLGELARKAKQSRYRDGPVVSWAHADPRWLSRCVAVADTACVAEEARALLDCFDAETTLAAAGGVSAVGDPPEQADLEAAAALARRAAERLRSLADRLAKMGYRFAHPAYTPPDPALVESVERALGAPLPAALAAFYQTLGSVCFAPEDETVFDAIGLADLGIEDMDPIEIWPLDGVDEKIRAWRREVEARGAPAVGPFGLLLAPDALHKANISGGPSYTLPLPNPACDPEIHHPYAASFLEMLRGAVEAGGFPGLSAAKRRRKAVRTLLAELSRED